MNEIRRPPIEGRRSRVRKRGSRCSGEEFGRPRRAFARKTHGRGRVGMQQLRMRRSAQARPDAWGDRSGATGTMSGTATTTIAAGRIRTHTEIRRRRHLGAEFRQARTDDHVGLGNADSRRGGALSRMNMRHASMSSRTGRHQSDQHQRRESDEYGRYGGPDGHGTSYTSPGVAQTLLLSGTRWRNEGTPT